MSGPRIIITPHAQEARMETATARYAGPFRVNKADCARPRRSHSTFELAEAEAQRLIERQPADAFVIVQEVAQVARDAT